MEEFQRRMLELQQELVGRQRDLMDYVKRQVGALEKQGATNLLLCAIFGVQTLFLILDFVFRYARG